MLQVKRLIAILFLGTVLFSATPMHQLLKLPVLVQHFFEHRQTDQSLNFLAYLNEHYFSGEDQDKDYKRDQQLPFKSHDHSVATVMNALPAADEKLGVDPIEDSYLSHILIDETLVSLQYLSSIWQPPKSC